jgi:hypothetical protein
LPTVSDLITGPGPAYESVQSLAPGHGMDTYKYEAREYIISGTANGQPYKTRLVVRRPSNVASFSGLVLTEPMHTSGSDHPILPPLSVHRDMWRRSRHRRGYGRSSTRNP